MVSAKARSDWSTAASAKRPVIPLPIKAGVLGIARAQRVWSSQRLISFRRIPAAMLRMSGPGALACLSLDAKPLATTLKSWGLIAMTSTLFLEKSKEICSKALMPWTPKSSCSLRAVVAFASTTEIWLDSNPLARRPLMRARPILPPPTKVMCALLLFCAILFVLIC